MGSLRTRRFCQLAKQPRRNSADTGVCELIAFSMPHCYVVLLFSKRQEILFSDATFKRIVSVDKHIVLLEESTTRNPQFDDDRFELVDMNKLFRMLSKLQF